MRKKLSVLTCALSGNLSGDLPSSRSQVSSEMPGVGVSW